MSDQQHAGPTLLQTWITLINQGNFEYLEGQYVKSWSTYKMLFTWLPLLCKEDCRQLRDTTEKEYLQLSQSIGTSYQSAQKTMKNQINNYLYKSIPIFAELAESSLETRKWIHVEESTAKPSYTTKGHLG